MTGGEVDAIVPDDAATDASSSENAVAPHARPPRWYRYARWLGRPPKLTSRQWRILGLVSAVSFFEAYDLFLLSLNLRQIQLELGIAEGSLGVLGSLIRCGALLALLIVPFADRFGRRRVLLFTVAGYTVATALTAFAPNVEVFVVLQFIARMFAVSEAVLATVVIVEEFSPANRGWGIGAAAALQACGAGFAAVMFGFVDVLPWGWRALYLIGVVPLFFIALWRRTLPETERFTQLASTHPVTSTMAFASVTRAIREHPRSLLLLCATLFCFSIAGNSASFFAPKYLQDVHGWAPSQIATLMFFGGALAVIGNPLSGWLSDRFGRRPTGMLFATGFALTLLVFYSSAGLLAPIMLIAYLFFTMGTSVTLSTCSVEIFPTSMRASASGITNFVSVLGSIAGLLGVSLLFGVTGSNWTAILILGGFSLVVAPVIVLWFPETAGRPLDEIAPESERDAGSAGR